MHTFAQCLRYQCPVSTQFSVLYFIKLNAFIRLDAVEDLMTHPTFETEFMEVAKGLPDLERIVSRIHAKNCKVKDFLKVLKVTLPMVISFSTQLFRQSFKTLSKSLSKLADASETFGSKTILGLLRSAPDLLPHVKNVEARFEKPEKGMLTSR